MDNWGNYLEFCKSDRQRQVVKLRSEGKTVAEVAEIIGINRRNVSHMCQRIKAQAAKQGYSPEHDMIHTVPDNFSVSGTSTLYKDGDPVMQWVKSKNDTVAMFEQALEHFKEGLVEDLKGKAKPVQKPKGKKDNDLASCYLIGDHHLGMLAWTPETGDDNYDIDISTKLLYNAVDTLAEMSSHAHLGILINLGDMMHANNLKNQTGSQSHTLDVDGRMGKAIKAVGQMYKRLITRMLESHNEVWIINVRGNHDPDASLWLNEMVSMYYENEARVKVFDNYNKFLHFQWGYNLVALHHGDKINVQRLYEKITSSLAKQWGESKYRFAWSGHIHHKQAHEIGGLHHESWNVLPPTDSYHSEHLYGSSRSMTSVLLHKQFGEHSRFKVGIDQL